MLNTRWVICFSVLALGLWASKSLAQPAEDPPLGDPENLAKEFKQNISSKFWQATRKPFVQNKEARELLDAAAQVFVWRCTWPEYVNDPKKLEEALTEFEDQYAQWILNKPKLGLNPPGPPDPEPKDYFQKMLKVHLGEVLDRNFKKNRVSTLSAAQMLPIVARSKDDQFGEFLVELINNRQQSDAVKLFAVRGLKEYFPLNPKANEEQRKQAIARVEALTNYIERKPPQPKWPETKNLQEIEAYCYLRREAIQALAKARAPAVNFKLNSQGNFDVEGQIAGTLLRVLIGNDFDPKPNVAEKCQAAIGLCNIKATPQYQPAYATHATGMFLIEFLTEYRKDLVKNIKDKKPPQPQYPWRTWSTELMEGLKYRKENDQNDSLPNDILRNARKMLLSMKDYTAIEIDETNEYGRWIREQTAPGKELFKLKAADLDP